MRYGTGSLLSEFGSGALQEHCRARAFALQSWFRRSSLWCFWQLDFAIKKALLRKNFARRRVGRASAGAPADNFSKWFGTVVPSSIPDSTAWSAVPPGMLRLFAVVQLKVKVPVPPQFLL